MNNALVWFRQDLRLSDNPALEYALKQHENALLLYILDEDSANPWPLGAAQRWWLHHSLSELSNAIAERGGQLILRRGHPEQILQEIVATQPIQAVYWNRCYEPYAIARDTRLKAELIQKELQVKTFNASLLQEPWNVLNKQGQFFKVYTPYWRHCLKTLMPRPLYPTPKKITSFDAIKSDMLADWNLLPQHPNWAAEFSALWQPGEAGAQTKLEEFLQHKLICYATQRDFPNQDVTSRLSPHLHFGEISPWQIWHAVQPLMHNKKYATANLERFLAEVGWREFSYYLLYHFPTLPDDNFRSEFNGFIWNESQETLPRWQQGKTGYPIVDAGMRELWRTGTMHNRVRMIVASFLIKDLLLDWRLGEKWFWDTLLDADLANNSASWQWVAGSGADAAPYFRIFNPVLQGEKFDPQGEYVKRWIPELAILPEKYIHSPWNASAEVLQQAGVTLGVDYPYPMVDHAAARGEAMRRYKAMK